MRITLLLTLLLAFQFSYGQNTVREREQALKEITEKAKAEEVARKKRVEKYLEENNARKSLVTEEGVYMSVHDIREDGTPVYRLTDNFGAAVTTGAADLATGTGLGLSLTGEGVVVGVWDGGQVRDTHVEFDQGLRISDEESTLNFHATHVAGTIKASGQNSVARGMAPDVTLLTHGWNNDIAEIGNRVRADETGMLLSNHSYGIGAGWTNGTWVGDQSISDQEDYRFGFYDSEARILDEIAVNSPYYLQVRSAGNHRNDSGPGFPDDGPYDIITLEKGAKNILTIGAVQKITGGYKTAQDVVMSSFSCWGPTDDGRIKPDLVGAGVNIFSTLEDFNEHYGNLSGTSMATPNVVGTLALLQDLSRKLNGHFMKAATLKGLAIHTAHEAGRGEGPDYEFGWGLMNAKGAADLMMNRNGLNNIIREITLENGEVFELDINPTAGERVEVTISWTDQPGTPVSPQLDPQDLMLVNDLDLRVISGTDTEYMPYILDPSVPASTATKGDNFRDNVEKVVFTAAEDGTHKIRISHKGGLVTGSQDFSLIVSYSSEESETFYRISDATDWDNPASWSFTSGGAPANKVPGENDLIVFDSLSLKGLNGQKIVMSSDLTINKIYNLSETPLMVDLNGFQLTTFDGLNLPQSGMVFEGGGTILIKNRTKGVYRITGDDTSFRDVSLIVEIDNDSEISVSKGTFLKSLTLRSGTLNLTGDLSLGDFIIEGSAFISGEEHVIRIADSLVIEEGASLDFTDIELIADSEAGDVVFDMGMTDFSGKIIAASGNLVIKNLNTVSILEASSSVEVVSEFTVDRMTLSGGNSLLINDGVSLNIGTSLSVLANAEFPVNIESTSGSASMTFTGNNLICLDHVNVDGVNAVGEGAYNLGVNGTATNATGWQSELCENVVFSDFSFENVCSGGVSKFESASNGDNLSYEWYYNEELVSEEDVTYLAFDEAVSTNVRLKVTNGDGTSDSYAIDILPSVNSLSENELIFNGTQLVSKSPAESFQWFKDDLPLEGETGRTIVPSGSAGIYYVVTSDGSCSRKSEEFTFSITSAEDEFFGTEINVYPNPANDIVNVALESTHSGEVVIKLTEISGREIFRAKKIKRSFQMTESVDTADLPDGLYVITIVQGQKKDSKLIAVKK